MTKLLIYIGENQRFDVEETIDAISSLQGTSRPRVGDFIGALFECEYTHNGATTVVRISADAETVTAEGLGDEALAFSLSLQAALSADLQAIDMDYSFNVSLRDFPSLDHLKAAVA